MRPHGVQPQIHPRSTGRVTEHTVMRVLVADKFESWGLEALRQAGCDVVYQTGLSADSLREAIARSDCRVLVVRSTQVTADMFEAAPGLGLVVRAGAGVNTIDIAAASARGVLVANCPGKNAVAVAELTFGLILALDRRIVDNVIDLRNGVWNKKDYSEARGLKGRKLGIIGMGEIGKAVALRALAFEMDVYAWSRSLTDELAEEYEIVACDSPERVAAHADILSIHLAATAETRGIIDRTVLDALAPGSYVINTARHEVMDYAALAEAVAARQLRVGIDVFPGEPAGATGTVADPILNLPGVIYGTHHIGASTQQAQDAIAAETVRIVREFAATGQAPNVVNIATSTPARCQLVIRHYDKVGVLASVLDQLRRARINVQEMTNTIFQGQKAAVAVIRVNDLPDDEVVRRIADMKDMIIQIEVKPI